MNTSDFCEKIEETKKDNTKSYIIIGGIVVAVILLVVIIIIIFRCIRKYRITGDPYNISFHKNANENLLYNPNYKVNNNYY